MRSATIAAIFAGWTLGIPSGASATTIRVPADYHTIQSAIDATDGDDTVLVSDGVWTGDGNYDLTLPDTTLVIISLHGASTTIIDCEGPDFLNHRAFNLSTGSIGSGRDYSVTILGFTIRNGLASGAGGAISGDRWILNLRYCIFETNRADRGGAISCESCQVNIRDSHFSYNLAADRGGAIIGPGSGTVSGCRFEFNQAETGGAMADFQNLVISNSLFHRNTAQFGSALSPRPGDSVAITVDSSIFSGNQGDAAVFIAFGDAHFSHCTFVANPGALALTGSSPTLTDCILSSNNGRPIVCYDLMPDRTSNPYLTYCCMNDGGLDLPGCGQSFYTMPNNFIGDPKFCDASADDFRLKGESPCVGTASDGLNLGALPIGCIATDTHDPDPGLPTAFSLDQNYPNPFNPSTTISFTLPYPSTVRVTVYDILGREIRTLTDPDAHFSAGSHALIWNGLDLHGAPAASGVYFCRLTTNSHSASRKMLLLK